MPFIHLDIRQPGLHITSSEGISYIPRRITPIEGGYYAFEKCFTIQQYGTGRNCHNPKDASYIVDKAPVDDLTGLLHNVNSLSKETVKQVELLSGNDLSATDGSTLSNSDKVRDGIHEEIRAHVDGLRSNINAVTKAAAINIYNNCLVKHDLNTPRLAFPMATHNYNALITAFNSMEKKI